MTKKDAPLHDFHKMAEVQRLLDAGDTDSLATLVLNLAHEVAALEARVAVLEGVADEGASGEVADLVARLLPKE